MSKKHSPLAHFVGIGGIGISALARWFLAKNWAVSGSDIAEGKTLHELRKQGVKVKIGHKKGNLPAALRQGRRVSPAMVIYNPAIPWDNPELQEARRLGIHPMSHVEVLGCLMDIYKTVCIAGSHGKSTTTAILGLILKEAGLDPVIVVGTKLPYLKGKNFRYGRNKLLVLEADEWKRSFLNYHPNVAVVTNIDKEHLDTYRGLADLKKTFLKFLGNTQRGGYLILNRSDKNLRSLKSRVAQIANRKALKVFWYSSKIRFDSQRIREILRIPGEHNVSNALAAFTVATKILGVKKSAALRAIGKYHGSWRRMEYRGRCRVSGVGCRVFDDYAHHPTEIRVTLKAFREKYGARPKLHAKAGPLSPIVCVYQPHQAQRFRALFQDFVGAFHEADILILLPVYEVPGRDTAIASRYTSKKLAEAIARRLTQTARGTTRTTHLKKVIYLATPKRIKRVMAALFSSPLLRQSASNPRQSAMIVMMGAGDIAKYTPLLLQKN